MSWILIYETQKVRSYWRNVDWEESVYMSKAKTVYPAERKVVKALLTLPADQVQMIDDCAKAIGFSRSAFLQVYFDTYAEQVMNFTEGWLAGIGYYHKKREENETLKEAKRVAEGLGSKLTVTKRKGERGVE